MLLEVRINNFSFKIDFLIQNVIGSEKRKYKTNIFGSVLSGAVCFARAKKTSSFVLNSVVLSKMPSKR